MTTERLTMAQALLRFLAACETSGGRVALALRHCRTHDPLALLEVAEQNPGGAPTRWNMR